MKYILYCCFTFFYLTALAQISDSTKVNPSNNYGIFENQTNIGKPAKLGTVDFNSQTEDYKLTGSGLNMWFGMDQFQYLYKSIQGDFILRTRVRFIGEGVEPHRKVGWIVRNNLSGNSPHVNATVHGDGLTSLQYRKTIGAETKEIVSTDTAPDIIQLERKGNTYIMSTAKFGEPFSTVKIDSIKLENQVFVGIYICSHNPDVVEEAIFSNVRIIKPVADTFVEYQDYIGSNMEIMNVINGQRKVLFRSSHAIQSPNWINHDKVLVYNSNGFLYRYRFRTGEVRQMNTGFAVKINNDHVFSFDEKILGISNHNENDDGNSAIYLMNSKGDSVPKQITRDGHGASYLHGISPDNKTLLFTGNRNGKYNIYGIDVASREEFQLTDTDGLDDGSEYSPDGAYIYFNSNRTGSMKLWRMLPDGTNPEQLTFNDNYKDWFPHISPDGKWIAFISFPPEIALGEHPFYKQCTLRIMPSSGGVPKIIAYIYGGQGTFNAPSWSEDSKRIAFVTNSD